MKFTSFIAPIAMLMFPTLSLAVSVAYDQTYDNASGSMSSVACSDGANGLGTKGYSTFGSLPNFPNIGAAAAVAGWNSPNCGTCWQLSYTGANGQTNTVNVIAMDHAADGFNIALGAMNTLTGGLGTELGRIDAQATQVASSVCGL